MLDTDIDTKTHPLAEPATHVRTLTIPARALVLLVGASGCGKSWFAHRHFKPTEIVSSDALRGWVSDDENDQSATKDAFEVLHLIVARRLARGRLTVVDATNLQPMARKSLLEVAQKAYVQTAAIVFDLPARLHFDRREMRTDRHIPPAALQRQLSDLRRNIGLLQREGIHPVHILRSVEETDTAVVVREPVRSQQTLDRDGPFDVIGDVHGCYDELVALLERLGYGVQVNESAPYGLRVEPPQGRTAIFLGDLVDRGPKIVPTLRLAMSMVQSGAALMVQGNHENKLLRALNGRNVQMTHGLPETLSQLAGSEPAFKDALRTFLDSLPSHYVLDQGRLVVAHAGLKESMHGRSGDAVRNFALYGETTGETDEFGFPIRYEWARDYRGQALVVYGHTAIRTPEWLNNTICVDTGCVYGGALTALRYPERELVSVPAATVHYASPSFAAIPPAEPPAPAPEAEAEMAKEKGATADADLDLDLLDLSDVIGQRSVETLSTGRSAIS